MNNIFNFVDQEVEYHVLSSLDNFKANAEKLLAVKAKFKFYRSHIYHYALSQGMDVNSVVCYDFCRNKVSDGFFATSVGDPVADSTTVVLDAIQLAYQMGYNTVYVGGVDLDYTVPYIYKGEAPEKHRRINTELAIKEFEFAEQVFRNDGRSLLKITTSPKLPLQYAIIPGVNAR